MNTILYAVVDAELHHKVLELHHKVLLELHHEVLDHIVDFVAVAINFNLIFGAGAAQEDMFLVSKVFS